MLTVTILQKKRSSTVVSAAAHLSPSELWAGMASGIKYELSSCLFRVPDLTNFHKTLFFFSTAVEGLVLVKYEGNV